MLVCDLVCISIDRAENLTFLLVSRKSLHEERLHGGCWIILGCWTWKTKKSTWRTSCDRCGVGTTRTSSAAPLIPLQPPSMPLIATLHNISHLYGPFLRLPVAGRWLTRLSKAYDLWLWRRSFAALQRLSLLDSWSWDWFLPDHACLSFIFADPSGAVVSALSASALSPAEVFFAQKLPATSGADASRFRPLFYCCFPWDTGGRSCDLGVFVVIFIPSRIFSEPHLFFGTYILYKLVIGLFWFCYPRA